jgi:Polysaccharide pyruvyl transferase
MKIAFVGASGYGNVGDNTYPLVLRGAFPEHQLIFYNSDLPSHIPEDIAVMAIGGGGLIYNSGVTPRSTPSHHFQCMKHYMEWANQRRIPWGFLSCGVQLRREHETAVSEVLAPWIPWLNKAGFITLRSPGCVKVVEALTGRRDVNFFPDLAYLFRPKASEDTSAKEAATFVVGGKINPADPFCQHLARLFRASELPICWLSMGAKCDDEKSIVTARRLFPESCSVAESTPDKAFRQIARSRFVVSGRYHGMVFARCNRVPFFVPEETTWKIRNEDYSVSMHEAEGHLIALRTIINSRLR